MPNGAYKQKTVEDWLLGVDMPNPEVVNDNIQFVHDNEMHNSVWNEIAISTSDYSNMRGPSAFWAGWYDLFLTSTLEGFDGYNTYSDESVRQTSVITIDPLGHCQDAYESFSQDTILGRTGLIFGQLFQVSLSDILRLFIA